MDDQVVILRPTLPPEIHLFQGSTTPVIQPRLERIEIRPNADDHPGIVINLSGKTGPQGIQGPIGNTPNIEVINGGFF